MDKIAEKLRGFIMKPHTAEIEQTIKKLIFEGENKFSTSEDDGHLVQEYVQNKMIKMGKRIKVNPRELPPLPLKGDQYYQNMYRRLYEWEKKIRARDRAILGAKKQRSKT